MSSTSSATNSKTNPKKHSTSIQSSSTSLGDASGVTILLGNHAKFGLAERCCYHFDLIETLTSLPSPRGRSRSNRRDRGISISSQDGVLVSSSDGDNVTSTSVTKENDTDEKVDDIKASQSGIYKAKSSSSTNTSTICGVVSLLECVTGGGIQPDRQTKRALRSKHREFNTRAQVAWGTLKRKRDKKLSTSATTNNSGTQRKCYQPQSLPLSLSPNTRVAFAYELTSIAILVDASSSLTSTLGVMDNFGGIGEEKSSSVPSNDYCVPLDRLGPLIKTYLQGLVKPIAVPPVSVSGRGIALGKWTPNLAVTVVAVYPPTSTENSASSAGLLVRDYRVTDEASALELAHQVERWALREVEGKIAQRLDFAGGDGLSALGSFSLPSSTQQMNGSLTSVKSSMQDILDVGNAALATLPPEGRPSLLVATDCSNVYCGGAFESLNNFNVDVPVSILDLSSNRLRQDIAANDSQSLKDTCNISGGIFINSEQLDSFISEIAGSPCSAGPTIDYHFSFKKRSIKPNRLQWSSIFSLSPFTPGHSSSLRPLSIPEQSSFYRAASSSIAASFSSSSIMPLGKTADTSNNDKVSIYDRRIKTLGLTDSQPHERVVLARYNIQPIRIKSLLMTRVVEGYRARRYGANTQDKDKVSLHLVMPLQSGVFVHYEASFVSSQYHIPTVGQAHIKLEISGTDSDFIQTVKKLFVSHGNEVVLHGRRVPLSTKVAAEKVCKLLRWTRKEDYLESYLCLPGWGDMDYFSSESSSFLSRIESLSTLQRFRHFRSEQFDLVTVSPSFYEKSASIFSDTEQNIGEEAIYAVLERWSTGIISDRVLYFKVISPAQEDDLAYYCIIRVAQSTLARLFTITIDFHGEIKAELRLSVLSKLKNDLAVHSEILVLEQCISRLVRTPQTAKDGWSSYFIHNKKWELLQDDEVLPLITKRRNEIGHFFILHSDKQTGVFAKFVTNQEGGLDDNKKEQDVVLYQIVSKANGIYVDICMEGSHSTFHPLSPRRSPNTTFAKLSERVQRRDQDCARNVKSRTNVLAALNQVDGSIDLEEDVIRLIKVSTCTTKKLRFFSPEGSSTANDLLSKLTTYCITSESFYTRAAKLSIDQETPILQHLGIWFIMSLDWGVLSIICLETADHIDNESPGSSQNFRHLSFFHCSTMDLYEIDDDRKDQVDLNEDDDEDSDNFELSDVSALIQAAHTRNYATACYQALRDTARPLVSFQEDEIAYALSSLSFITSLETLVSVDDISDHLGEHSHTTTGIKLGEVIESLLTIVPGSNGHLFFYNGDEIDDSEVDIDLIEKDDGSTNSIEEEAPPLFFRFTLDEKLVSMNDILALKKSAALAAQVSVYQSIDSKPLPTTHSIVSSKIQHHLDSFEAEQVLEKLRYTGCLLTQDIISQVMLNISKTRHKSFEMSLEFFMSQSQALVAADNLTGRNERDLEHCLRVLMAEFDRDDEFLRANEKSFLVLDDSASREVLPYFCFITIQKARGVISASLYHPLGDKSAEEQLQVTLSLVKRVCDRTNQLLLLDSLYNTKNACRLLIEEEDVEEGDNEQTEAPYSCLMQKKLEFPLHRRCAPQQAILALETGILQNFRISNRRGLFVYKDESDHVFYMKLNWIKTSEESADENLHVIELLVYGCEAPGPSITVQLFNVLRRKLLTLTLDSLSSLLRHNPWFNLLNSDVAFIRNFESELKELDNNEDRPVSPSSDSIRTYSLPPNIRDPLILMLMFRQNICGNTFIQHLHRDVDTSSDKFQLKEEDNGDIKLCFSKLPDFQFYFNSSPSQLDPNLVNTSTEKGKQFSRQAGSGIAIIEVNLEHGTHSECELVIGKRSSVISNKLHVSLSDITLCANNSDNDNNTGFKIQVKIANTTCDIDIIHRWVELSLSQVLVAWSIECHLASSRHGSLQYEEGESSQYNYKPSIQSKQISINKTLPGIVSLEEMIRFADKLPHPAVSTVDNRSMIRATGLANLTLRLLEALLISLSTKDSMLGRVNIIRYTKANGSSLVKMTNDSTRKSCARVEVLDTRKVVKDRATDDVEYITIFGFNNESQIMSVDTKDLFFQHVRIQVSSSSNSQQYFSQALSKIKNANPSLFQRHMIIILRVSKSRRTLMTYNANPHLMAKLGTTFEQIDHAFVKADEQKRGSHISFLPDSSPKQEVAEAAHSSTNATTSHKPRQTIIEEVPEKPAEKRPARRIPRPTSMLRPTLIGKSVAGSTASAMQASRMRARATSRPSMTQRTISSGKTKVESNKAIPRTKKRESLVRSSQIPTLDTPQSSLVKIYILFTSLLKDGSESLMSQHRLNQSALQNLAHLFFKGTPTVQSTRLLCTCYGTFVGNGSVSLLTCDSDKTSIDAFANHITKRWGVIRIATEAPENNVMYLQKDLLTGAYRKVIAVLEASIQWDNSRKSFTLNYNAWLINSADKSARKDKRKSLKKREQEAALIEAISLNFLDQLNIECELFNFECLRVIQSVRGTRRIGATTLSMLKSIISKYQDTEVQAQLPSPRYRLQRRYLSLSSFLDEPLLECCNKRTIIKYLQSNHQTYNLQSIDSEDCFVGKLNVGGFMVYYFITWHEYVEDALDVFVLTSTRGQFIDGYMTKEGSPIAERVLNVIIYSIMSTVQDTLEKIAKEIRQQCLWKQFSEKSNQLNTLGASTLVNNITELRASSFHLDLTLVDERLKTLLYDESNDLEISWRGIFNTIDRSSSFSHCITLNEGEASTSLIYSEEANLFLDISFDLRGKVKVAQLLTQYSMSANAAKHVVDKFTMFVLKSIWDECESSV